MADPRISSTLVTLRRSAGVAVLAAFWAATAAAQSTLDELGGFALRSDIAQLNHETQYSRLFRS